MSTPALAAEDKAPAPPPTSSPGQAGQPAQPAAAATSAPPATEPFAFGDFTWLNGNNRQRTALLDSRYFTGTFTLDTNFNYSFNHPIDHTNVGSTATFREGELNLSFVGFGGDFHYENVRGRLLLQFGTRATGVPRNDLTPLRGQYDLYTALRYLSEAYAGYHWDTWHGINLDVGIFMSYVGLMSYNNFENWSYQPSYTSDNTPWFFNGARLQMFPTDRFKVELWLINGWQTYAMANGAPGVGYQFLYRPREWVSLVFNGYVGFDTLNTPGRMRFHSDNSFQLRYYNHPGGALSRAAFSLTGDLGFENGGGVTPFGGAGGPAQNFISGMVYHRLWFANDLIGWTIGGGRMHNPGRYLVLLPTGVAATTFTANPGDPFDAWDMSTSLQYMPTEYITWGLEVVHREANVPYFAGPGGVSGPTGNALTPIPAGWQPDLVKAETRIIASMIFRM